MREFKTVHLSQTPVYAPDGSEIRELGSLNRASMAHCTLHPGQMSKAVKHKTVEEVWYFIQGQGQVYRKQGEWVEITEVTPGISVTIPTGTHFQFRNTGDGPLCFIIATMPPWPGADEAVAVDDYWVT